MKLKKLLLLTLFIISLIWATQVQAVCPVCTVVVSAGIGLSRWLGVDDSISGLWLGGLIVSLILWTLHWLDHKNIHIFARSWITVFSYYLLILLPLFVTGILGHPNNTLWGIDKLLLGITVGSAAFYGGAQYYTFIKKKHHGHAYFPFQKIVMPIAPLMMLSLVFFYLTQKV